MSEAPLESSQVKPSVLIVDDERAFLEMLMETFAETFEIVTVVSAEEAEQPMAIRRFDVIVCDHLMPGMPGLEFLVSCAQRWPQTRRILLTGYINPEMLSRSVPLADLSACLLKPVRPTELAEAIQAAIKA